MSRHYALVALWAIFAAAAVGVGFGAAGLAGDPFTGPDAAGQVGTPAPGISESPTSSPSPSASRTPSGPSPSRTGTSAPRGSDGSGGGQVRSITTRAGYVSARCSGGLVSVSASPAVGWALDDVTGGRVERARVRFQPDQDARGERVEVITECGGGGLPWFAVEDDGSGGGDDGSGGGDDGGSGSGGSGSGGSGSGGSGSGGSGSG